METAEHREPYEPRGSRTDLGAPGGESPPGDSTDPAVPNAKAQRPVSDSKTALCGRRLITGTFEAGTQRHSEQTSARAYFVGAGLGRRPRRRAVRLPAGWVPEWHGGAQNASPWPSPSAASNTSV